MNKDNFIKIISFEDKAVVSKIYEKIIIAEKTGGTIYTNEFYPPVLWNKIKALSGEFYTKVFCDGGFSDSERRMIAFSNEGEDELSYPFTIIRIKNLSKFSKLDHRDYLGAIMSLGIKREKFGDLIVKDDQCFLSVSDDVYSYIQANISQIGKNPCEVMYVSDINDVPNFDFKESVIISSSNRLDCIVSAITGLSRSKGADLISSGKVLLNYIELKEKDKEVDEDSTLTIRGYGKFKFFGYAGETNSGRLKLIVKKFI